MIVLAFLGMFWFGALIGLATNETDGPIAFAGFVTIIIIGYYAGLGAGLWQ